MIAPTRGARLRGGMLGATALLPAASPRHPMKYILSWSGFHPRPFDTVRPGNIRMGVWSAPRR